MNAELVRQIWLRAGRCCKYCRIRQDRDDSPFEIDHIIARKHGGPTVPGNLALSCLHCNLHKGSDIASLDPLSRKLSPLFHPRRHNWARHFRWQGAVLVGRTAIGRVTVSLLNVNHPFRVRLREELIAADHFPPA
ncbi:MAG: HNH endonuclease [Gemmataceae bacterium]